MKLRVVAAVFAVSLLYPFGAIANPPPGFQSEIVVVGLDQPTTITFTPDGRMLVGELSEVIWVVPPGAAQPNTQPFRSCRASGGGSSAVRNPL